MQGPAPAGAAAAAVPAADDQDDDHLGLGGQQQHVGDAVELTEEPPPAVKDKEAHDDPESVKRKKKQLEVALARDEEGEVAVDNNPDEFASVVERPSSSSSSSSSEASSGELGTNDNDDDTGQDEEERSSESRAEEQDTGEKQAATTSSSSAGGVVAEEPSSPTPPPPPPEPKSLSSSSSSSSSSDEEEEEEEEGEEEETTVAPTTKKQNDNIERISTPSSQESDEDDASEEQDEQAHATTKSSSSRSSSSSGSEEEDDDDEEEEEEEEEDESGDHESATSSDSNRKQPPRAAAAAAVTAHAVAVEEKSNGASSSTSSSEDEESGEDDDQHEPAIQTTTPAVSQRHTQIAIKNSSNAARAPKHQGDGDDSSSDANSDEEDDDDEEEEEEEVDDHDNDENNISSNEEDEYAKTSSSSSSPPSSDSDDVEKNTKPPPPPPPHQHKQHKRPRGKVASSLLLAPSEPNDTLGRIRFLAARVWRNHLERPVTRVAQAVASSPIGPYVTKGKFHVQRGFLLLSEDVQEVQRLRRSIASKPRSEWNLKHVLQLPRIRLALARLVLVLVVSLFMLTGLFGSSAGFGRLPSRPRRPGLEYPEAWKRARSLSYEGVMDLIHVHDNSVSNASSVRIKRMPTLDKPVYLSMSSKDLVQIKRPAVRKKRPDEPRAVRTFGCLRDGCRGLEIEDLLDRGWQMRFRAAQKNDTYKNINYRVTFLLTDTTQLNHMRAVRPDLYDTIYNTYEKKCYLIAFDGADAIGGNKGQQLKVKEKFVRKYGCKFSELGISPSSYRLYLEDECEDLVNFGSSEVTWLLKPETGSQGQGITFHTEISDIMQKQSKFFPCAKREWKSTERYLVQEYIESPLLLKKSKFDARVYMNVASSSPFLVFYHEGYLRRALAPYAPLSRDRRVYLTNTHFQSMKKDFKLSEHIWSFQEFQAYLKETGRTGAQYITSILNPQIKKVALFIFHSARQKLKKRKGTFHIMGLDFMIDDEWAIHFIEANGFPGFTWSINFDTRTMVEEWFNLAQQVHENPRFYMLMREGDRYGGFEMIFSEMEEERTQQMYNPCQEFKFNRGYTAPLKEANVLFAKISGKDGRTDKFKRFSNTIKGAHLMGGSRHDQLKARQALFQKHGCRANSVHFMPPQYALYESEECNSFFTENAANGYAWVLKPVSSAGQGEDLRVYASTDDLKQEYGDCQQRVPDVVVQRLVSNRVLTKYKWWDIRVYLLIASTKPFMVFYHHGFARTSKLSYVPGGEAKNDVEGGGESTGGGAGNKDVDAEEDVVDVGDEGGDEDEDDMASSKKKPRRASSSASSGDDDEGDASSRNSGSAAAAAAAASSSSSASSFASSEEGGGEGGEGGESAGQSVDVALDGSTLLPNEPPPEPWAPPKITTGAQWTLNEDFMTLENFEDEMARAELVGSRWLSSVFDTYAKRVALVVFQQAREQLERGNETYQITSLNFLLDDKLQITFVGARNVDADSIPNVDTLTEHKANFLETLAGVVLEMQAMPAAFARMRRGDSYGQWRLVFSEMEEKQRSMVFDPCDEFRRNLQVSKSSLFKDAWLHQHVLKSHARNKRELRKYIDRKWESACKSRPTAELRASCIRNTISYRYKQYLEKERLPYQEGYVENYIRELQNRPNTPGKGASQGGGL